MLLLWVLMASPHVAGQGLPPLVEPKQEEAQAYRQAQEALAAHDWVRAELLLERVLMFNADHAQARVQLAMVLAQRGQIDAASALIESLMEDERTPQDYRVRLGELLGELAAPGKSWARGVVLVSEKEADTTGQYSVALGYSSNPFARADLSSLTFTLADTELTLPVVQTIQPAPFVHNTIAVQVAKACTLEVADQRWQGHELAYSNRAALVCQNPLSSQGNGSEVVLGYRRGQDATERSYAGVAIQWRELQVNTQLFDEPATARQGMFVRVRYLAPQEVGTTAVHGELELGGSAGKSFAGAGVRHERPFGSGAVAGVAVSLQADLGGYSPLLSSNAPRNMALSEVYVRQHWGLRSSWHLVAEAVYTRRWSNLPLFDYEDATLQLRWLRPF